MITSTNVTAAAFYYTPNGIKSESTPLEHMAIGQAWGIVADGRKNLEQGRLVLNYCKLGNQFYAQVGISTGKLITRTSDEFWSDWSNYGLVFEVMWISPITPIPASEFSSQRQKLSGEVTNSIINRIMRQGSN